MSRLTVGEGQQFATIAAAVAAAKDGDFLAIEAGTYRNDFATITKQITLEGVGGMALLEATEAPPNGKAILTIGADVTIRNLGFSGAEVADGNGAGIRFEGGDLVIEDSLFEGNQMGLLSGAVEDGSITIRGSEFAGNGTGDGRTHNLYVGEIARLTIEDSQFRDAVVGHQIKSRALETSITGSRIADGEGGTGSYSIDLPVGGRAVIAGNVIEQSAQSGNPAIIHFGGEGEAHAGSSLTISGNQVVNALQSPSAALLLNQTDVRADVAGNAVIGLTAQQVVRGLAEVTGLEVLDSVADLAEPLGLRMAQDDPWG
ncbi:hypothetical protein [Falsiroseomonas sp. E2-1-a20]|uniref:hypothetical protein n=1 Tax=Falsiroseomonas sp. E2-1-a20 TaxID=3239300 RepID=UPI003F38259D